MNVIMKLCVSWQGKPPLVLQQGLFGQLDEQTFTDVVKVMKFWVIYRTY